MKEENSYKGDMLDIVFENKNKAYGAYQLRRTYANSLSRATAFALLLIVVLLALPKILNAFRKLVPDAKALEVEARINKSINIEAKPKAPEPRAATPKQFPTRPTIRFVPPVIMENDKVKDDDNQTVTEDFFDTNTDVGVKTSDGNANAEPSPDEPPTDFIDIEEPKVNAEKTYEMFDIQKPPGFPGGDAGLVKFLSQNIVYPDLAKESDIQGIVVLSFVVNKDGTVGDVQIVREIGGGCGKEAVRVVKNMPKWSAGEANGHPVKVRFTLPVRFRLD